MESQSAISLNHYRHPLRHLCNSSLLATYIQIHIERETHHYHHHFQCRSRKKKWITCSVQSQRTFSLGRRRSIQWRLRIKIKESRRWWWISIWISMLPGHSIRSLRLQLLLIIICRRFSYRLLLLNSLVLLFGLFLMKMKIISRLPEMLSPPPVSASLATLDFLLVSLRLIILVVSNIFGTMCGISWLHKNFIDSLKRKKVVVTILLAQFMIKQYELY